MDVCPEGDIFTFSEDEHKPDRVSIGPNAVNARSYKNALGCDQTLGQHTTVEECMDAIRRDKGYYDRSGGGVTVSGGDPLVQSDFVAALFKQCKEGRFSDCLESTFLFMGRGRKDTSCIQISSQI